MNKEIINYLISRGVSIEDIQKLVTELAEIEPKEKNIFDIDFQKQILFNSTFLSSSSLCILVREMNCGDAVMVERILDKGREKTYTPEEIVEALGFHDIGDRENNINELYTEALQLTLQKRVYSQLQSRLKNKE